MISYLSWRQNKKYEAEAYPCFPSQPVSENIDVPDMVAGGTKLPDQTGSGKIQLTMPENAPQDDGGDKIKMEKEADSVSCPPNMPESFEVDEEPINFPEIPEDDPGQDQDEDLYRRLRKLKKSDQNSASPTCWEAAKLTASPFRLESRRKLTTNENWKKEQNKEYFDEEMLKTKSTLPCPSLPVMTELNTAPCGGTRQHKEQDVQPHIASGTVSQAHIPQLKGQPWLPPAWNYTVNRI